MNINEIRTAGIRAAEDAVCRDLEAKGLTPATGGAGSMALSMDQVRSVEDHAAQAGVDPRFAAAHFQDGRDLKRDHANDNLPRINVPVMAADGGGYVAHELTLEDMRHAGGILQAMCHGASLKAGWWTHRKTGLDLVAVIRNPQDDLQELLAGALVAQKLCLGHSEISEAMEGHRKGLMDDKLSHRTMLEVELADGIIRLFDLAGAMGLDVGGAIAEKMAFNAVREDHRPENRAAAGGKAY